VEHHRSGDEERVVPLARDGGAADFCTGEALSALNSFFADRFRREAQTRETVKS
jgi:hypothetical protein